MPLLENNYCAEQIEVPSKLPVILKQFCKSAIRTQPYDLLKWSSAYFRALADGEEPPCKLRLEYPEITSPYGLTLGYLKVLFRQLGGDYEKVLPLEYILTRWDYLCLDPRDANLIIMIGKFRSKCHVKLFLAIAAGLIGRSLTETMILICQLFTFEPDGGSAMIPLGLFMELYGYLAGLRCDGEEKGSEDSSTTGFSRTPTSSGSQTSMSRNELPEPQAKQDTDQDDTDLELESFSKEEIPSATTLRSFGEESESSFRHEGEASFRSSERTESFRTHSSETEQKVNDQDEVGKSPPIDEPSPNQSTTNGSKQSHKEATNFRLSSESSDSINIYPDVPGIGPRVLAQEIATVAIWMSECGRRQGGMVGPRNIRHINCPPLGTCCQRRNSNNDV